MRKIYLALVFLGALAIITAAALIWPATTTYFLGKGKKNCFPKHSSSKEDLFKKFYKSKTAELWQKRFFTGISVFRNSGNGFRQRRRYC